MQGMQCFHGCRITGLVPHTGNHPRARGAVGLGGLGVVIHLHLLGSTLRGSQARSNDHRDRLAHRVHPARRQQRKVGELTQGQQRVDGRHGQATELRKVQHCQHPGTAAGGLQIKRDQACPCVSAAHKNGMQHAG